MKKLLLILILTSIFGCKQSPVKLNTDQPNDLIYLDGCIDGVTGLTKSLLKDKNEYTDDLEKSLIEFCIKTTVKHII